MDVRILHYSHSYLPLKLVWLCLADRLWIQREPPKPLAPPKRKRKPAPRKSAKKASTSKTAVQEDSDSEPEPEPDPVPQKRTRTTNGRATRTQAKTAETLTTGRGTRAAKLQANKKLDAQAKELAEFQRLAAASEKSSPRSTRNTRSNGIVQESKKPIRGTRASARLRGASMDDDDDEWQQVPEEWLQETINDAPVRNGRAQRTTRSRAKPVKTPRRLPSEDDADDDAPHTGLSDDDAVSALTELSDDQSEANVKSEEKAADAQDQLIEDAQPKVGGEPEKKLEVITEGPTGHTTNHMPPGFVEWELVSTRRITCSPCSELICLQICVTLPEWEEIVERFASATHYLDKRLHKELSAVTPDIVAELKASSPHLFSLIYH